MSSESILLVTTVPNFVSPEEHRNIVASTPPSFSDIPSILRHKEENVSVSLDPPLNDFSPEHGANGVLYIIESVLVFMSSTDRGFQVKYPAITLHAISRAEGSRPSIYCQLDEADSGSLPDDADATNMRELIITPQNPDSLEPIFEAMSICASLHPDPNISEGDELDGDFVSDSHFEILEGEELSEVGRAALAHLESIIYDPFNPEAQVNGSLDDAEEVSTDPDEVKD